MTLLQNLPADDFKALKLTTPHTRLLPVKRAEDMGKLPTDPQVVYGKYTSRKRRVLQGVYLVAGTCLGVGFITGNALNHGGVMPLAWDIIWILFPWVFLLPLWRGYFRGWRSATRTQQKSAEDYAAFSQAALHVTGTVIDRILRVDRTNRAVVLVLLLHTQVPGRPMESLVVSEFAAGNPPLESESPQVGDTVIVWIDPHPGGSGEKIVQSNQAWSRRQERAAEQGATADPDLAE
ncbi:hypothetical protein GCM10022198_13030 [Klugiella xanthotipulae]|uniref:Uncharacterized protein n=1 Tax=Klugiella xanthotipulae TaxID=244735 RepID=A0A543I4I5_9MICO|nr:hypothetical protein [Klugiella xanthotipulae]TQM65390.1 hypothetical protein FB466_0190 [Klugiella xanthotipulae]